MAWNTENEDGHMNRIMERPHKAVLNVISSENSDISNIMCFPATRRELLDKLRVRVVVFNGRIEVKAIFSIEPIYSQKCTSPS